MKAGTIRRCVECDEPFTLPSGPGRPGDLCSARCRTKYRTRKQGERRANIRNRLQELDEILSVPEPVQVPGGYYIVMSGDGRIRRDCGSNLPAFYDSLGSARSAIETAGPDWENANMSSTRTT